jgi:hypothetical protein
MKTIEISIDGSGPVARTRDGYISLNVEFYPDTFAPLADPKV